MDDALVVSGGESIGDLQSVFGNFALRERAGAHFLAERLAFEKFGDEVVDAGLSADVVDGEEIGMVEGAEDARFLFETLQTIGIIGERFGKDFDGDGAVEARVASAIDFSHATRADGRNDFVGAKSKALSEAHERA